MSMTRQTSQSLKVSSEENSRFFTVIKGVIYSYMITIPFFIAFALILTYTNFPERHISLAVIITTVASILIGGSTSTKSLKSKGWLYGGIVGLLYMLILHFLSSIVFKNFTIDRYALINGFIGVLSGAVGGIIGINSGTKIKSRVKRRR